MSANVLITGGSGLVGTRLTELLQKKGYTVSYLSRNGGEGKIKKYQWNLADNYIDPKAISEADYIIHLAGAGVFDKRWTDRYKKEIIDSRVKSTRLLYDRLMDSRHHVKAFISASAIGIYGFDTGDKLITEESPQGPGFLAEVVKLWEQSIEKVSSAKIRLAKIRVGIVLSDKGGALKEMGGPVRLGIGSPLGSGSQYLPWIHIDDLCEMFIKGVEDESFSGVFNGVAPNPVTNKEFIKAIAKTLKKPFFMPNVPAFALKLILGSEKAAILLGGNKISALKIQQSGFNFKYPLLDETLTHLLKKD